jgi:hypothetical protein
VTDLDRLVSYADERKVWPPALDDDDDDTIAFLGLETTS